MSQKYVRVDPKDKIQQGDVVYNERTSNFMDTDYIGLMPLSTLVLRPVPDSPLDGIEEEKIHELIRRACKQDYHGDCSNSGKLCCYINKKTYLRQQTTCPYVADLKRKEPLEYTFEQTCESQCQATIHCGLPDSFLSKKIKVTVEEIR